MTIDQFANAMRGFGEELRTIDDELLEIGGLIVQALKAAAPRDSGALKNSIQAVVQDNQILIEMLAYGVFQNYGVDGMNQRRADRVPFGIDPRPAAGDRYGFSGNYTMIGGDLPFGVRTSIYQKGLAPQHWFDIDTLADQITNEIANRRDI